MKKLAAILGLLGLLSQPASAQFVTGAPVIRPGEITGGAASVCPTVHSCIPTGGAAPAGQTVIVPVVPVVPVQPVMPQQMQQRNVLCPSCPVQQGITGGAAVVTPPARLYKGTMTQPMLSPSEARIMRDNGTAEQRMFYSRGY